MQPSLLSGAEEKQKMKATLKIPAFFALALTVLSPYAFAWDIGAQGLANAWLAGSLKRAVNPSFGFRFLPAFSLEKQLSGSISLSAEFSLNAYGTGRLQVSKSMDFDGKLKPYRAWVRFSSSQFEIRAGLQKINFGSALLLRPLMWFDRIDPRDPLQLTDGVYALLGRYYFLNNTNIWFWTLYGNKDTKGWELFPTRNKSMEIGGRIQSPFAGGELALTYHHRQAEPQVRFFTPPAPQDLKIPENRIGLDGRWDIGPGVWFEAVLIHQENRLLFYPWQKALNLGFDYTFSLGNGLYLVSEFFILQKSRNIGGKGESTQFSAISLNYPLGLLDSMTGIFYYDWKNRNMYSFIRWQRAYDRWAIHCMAFWNPEVFTIYQNRPGDTLFSGKGFQIMVVFNY